MGRPKGSSKKQTQQGSTGNRKIVKKAKQSSGNDIGKFFNTQMIEHNLKLGVNIFDQLNVKETNKQTNKQTSKQTSISKNPRPPPVIVTGKNHDIYKILNENGIERFNMKNISIGTKIFVENDNDFTKISSYLRQNNIEFYSHGERIKKYAKLSWQDFPKYLQR